MENTCSPSSPKQSRPAGKGRRVTLLVLAGISVVAMYGLVLFLYGRTFVPLPMLLSLSLLFAVVTYPLLGRKWTALLQVRHWAWNIVCHLPVAGIAASAALLGVNYWGADKTDALETTLRVDDVCMKKVEYHHRGRRTTRSDRFYMVVSNESGQQKEMLISRERYNQLARRSHLGPQQVKVTLNNGRLGWMIITAL